MEFIKLGKRWLVKNSGGRIVSEKEKLELENKELIINDIKSNECQGKTTQKIVKNKKRIKEIEKENVKINIDLQSLDSKRIANYIKEQTALEERDGADDTIKETDKSI